MMKNLTHYFTDNVKSIDDSVIAKSDEVISVEKIANGNEHIVKMNINGKKRERVKIKISQSNNRGKICNIVNNKNDLIDKTPSPHTKLFDKKIISCDDTPKRSNSSYNVNNNCEINDQKVDLDTTDECIFDVDVKKKFNNKKNKIESLQDNSTTAEQVNGREEPNAFHVLMTRNKPGKIICTKKSTDEGEEDQLEIKNSQDLKSKLKQNKEKLITLADKKGYTKRKLREKEEEEIIEKQVENRIKMFKGNSSNNIDGSNIITPKPTPRGLYNYFSTITPEERERAKSKMVVEAEIHDGQISSSSKQSSKSTSNINNKKNKSRVRKILATIDDIQVLNSESSSPSVSPTTEESKSSNESSPSHKKKRKWSMRINLQSPEIQDETGRDSGSEIKNQSQDNHIKQKKNKHKDKKKNKSNKGESTEDSHEEDEINNVEDKNACINNQILIDNDTLPDEKLGLDYSEIEVIETKILKRPSNEKLAPLFVKRSKLDPDVIAARRSFLHSRSPENEKKKSERKVIVSGIPMLPFPSASHITQLNVEDRIHEVPCSLKYKIKEATNYTPTFDLSNFLSIINLSDSVQDQKLIKDETKSDAEEILKEIEERCSDAREMWTKINLVSNKQKNEAIPKKRGRKSKSADKESPAKKIEDNVKVYTWTEKYKPICAKEIVGNEEAAGKLRDWLSSWQSPTEKDDYSSSEEFYSSDNSHSGGLNCSQVAVLLGPHGSGKTASVYAIAKELGYNVLEVNASSKRPGRKILKDLEEATKSHHVKKSDGKILFQASANNDKKTMQNSLILFEDVDIIFDEDDGFISATYQLAANTKRPIVMTCRDSCSHLSRMAPQQLRICYQTTYGSRVSALLELITLAESGTRLPQSCLNKLIAIGDLRKALLQLQYILISGIPQSSLLPSDFHKTLWQDMRNYLYKPVAKLDKKQTKKKNLENVNGSNLDIMDNLADDLDAVSLVSSLVDIDDHILNITEFKYEPSLSLEETMDSYSSNDVRSMEIGKWLRHRVMNKYTTDTSEIDTKLVRQLSLKKELNTGINTALSQISINNSDSRSVSIDYLPAIRTICRSEEIKSSNNTKRRFFHYLQNFRLPYGQIKPNILQAACKAMQEKNEKSLQR
ncbi:Similar to ATAD5: ATPase family AAA domain-containing protein 5 (Homo sapiens) [Cotesia congregata]|uniref:Similar to ATAD5: ATPase family AAA domain-containing protein 5 (Homo sapiens) n=1 Tax=Cotesia congregata TaxID=51543 RepID=A0A8J2ML90_COTCN|nr:Similar to ATAD5: ATPase family AAA domain-containing protein 5 (Homo sapiens) [Cotesia congregata]